MRFCLKPGAVSLDPAARIGYCRATGIETVQESSAAVPGFAEARQLDPRALRSYVRQFTDAGVDVAALGLGQVTTDVVLGAPAGAADFQRACQDVEAIAEAGVKVITTGLPIDRQPTEAENREQLARAADYYNRLSAVAERAGVRLATHSPWPPNRRGWLWGNERFAELFAAAPGLANGYLYDNAIHHMLGEDPAAAVRQFGRRIVFVHIRDVRKSAGDGAAATGYDEVFPGTGELDFRSLLVALRDVGYTGVLCPEHYPPIPGDERDAAATTYAVGYLRGILDSLGQ
jgi:sugar phosphate isomerase/epimerase